ncbi:helix-turn-helix domain protein [Solidesulfovibrio fructosivorans JJ]]|uniref:Helix-turn-helix domain protein n=1 Tax=Solidesulfovibrio fructosivorans JJ] TaxID=596151 RepID=E1JXY4_SOLFR|nr:helix-turn-helix domain-containing protein [Solidesulfovibrio fructosivorans]EFL50722.1 helix-turn-helix domain protein [Solidesulfovibrio fructosivorans JJ]]
MEIHDRLELTLRKIPGENVEEKAKVMGVAGPTLYAYLRGKRVPSTEFLLNLKAKTGVSLDWLLTGECVGEKSNEIDQEYLAAVEERLNVLIQSGVPIKPKIRYFINNYNKLLTESYNFLINDYDIKDIDDGLKKILPFLKITFTLTYPVDDCTEEPEPQFRESEPI